MKVSLSVRKPAVVGPAKPPPESPSRARTRSVEEARLSQRSFVHALLSRLQFAAERCSFLTQDDVEEIISFRNLSDEHAFRSRFQDNTASAVSQATMGDLPFELALLVAQYLPILDVYYQTPVGAGGFDGHHMHLSGSRLSGSQAAVSQRPLQPGYVHEFYALCCSDVALGIDSCGGGSGSAQRWRAVEHWITAAHVNQPTEPRPHPMAIFYAQDRDFMNLGQYQSRARLVYMRVSIPKYERKEGRVRAPRMVSVRYVVLFKRNEFFEHAVTVPVEGGRVFFRMMVQAPSTRVSARAPTSRPWSQLVDYSAEAVDEVARRAAAEANGGSLAASPVGGARKAPDPSPLFRDGAPSAAFDETEFPAARSRALSGGASSETFALLEASGSEFEVDG